MGVPYSASVVQDDFTTGMTDLGLGIFIGEKSA